METFLTTSKTFAPQILILAFLIITFLQSGFDKVLDWKSNLSFLKEHFTQNTLKNNMSIILSLVLFSEIVVSLLCISGIIQIYWLGKTTLGFYGAALSAIVLLMLLFGQRLAKDYPGAMTIAVYFITAVFGVFLLNL